MGEVERGGEDWEMTNTFNTLGTSTSLDPWNPAYSVSSESPSRPRTEALRDVQWTSQLSRIHPGTGDSALLDPNHPPDPQRS